jgi:hypothetical protein
MKRLTLLAVVALFGCPEEKKAAPPAAEKKAEAPAAPAAPAAEKKGDSIEKPGVVVTHRDVRMPEQNKDAECEFGGNVDVGELKPARIVFTLSKAACDAPDFEAMKKVDLKPGSFFAEVFMPQGSVVNVCAFALDDKGQQIGTASYEKNPVKLEGAGEVVTNPVELKLAKGEPKAAPKGL